ncbi:histidine kinase-, DNA gyrase b-, and HSP90-like ATPase domain-containing protein [Hirsutella rhossiliensis]|uniref:Histidine kinase-, DNA gyrase b-, and HSP90-like ATPase domain-containing protein n=1 Tax=Hirsutella rhossiliensis TaxID=111463 RepID=A0A9P8SDX9_9HYPO|nr:histidine kinase-, DNA gyrase b-, and HSP90-like ATPase domain-containing protein [Hirsutella rhossiliensis]KAH0957471.1 histidine kinase-, DNA gyrase b-, and HSP90-like ATPase domain-containing protein [Hirsutella rhossiliensis]
MAISALPQATVRLLGASTNIASPYHLVKELLDNAIDARATTVEISISADTLEKISVRDNGHGIAVQDFESLGRRAHTSKLRSFGELQTKGGKTLGFRGEALASANAVSSIAITTKVSGDPVASRLQLRFAVGGVEQRRPVSAPVGTTVQATQLFKNMPARKQLFIKERNKSVSSIKSLLKSYALARPHLKLSFRVTDDGSQSWSYSPNGSPTVREATLQIFGGGLATNCVHMTVGENNRGISIHDQQPKGFVLDAFLPRPDCDVKAITGKGSFISVDQRPVSPTRGLPKRIVSALKSQFSEHMARIGSTNYDPNVSPLKDEVLFADEKGLIECFEKLCRELAAKGGCRFQLTAKATTLLALPLGMTQTSLTC